MNMLCFVCLSLDPSLLSLPRDVCCPIVGSTYLTDEVSESLIQLFYNCIFNWRASVASETLTGVTQSKIGDVCLFIYLYICLDVCMSFCTLTLAFLCYLCGRPRPKLH